MLSVSDYFIKNIVMKSIAEYVILRDKKLILYEIYIYFALNRSNIKNNWLKNINIYTIMVQKSKKCLRITYS